MKLPNAPQTPPRLQMLQWITRPFELLDACVQRYGDLFTLRVGPKLNQYFSVRG